MKLRNRLILIALGATALSGCRSSGEIVVDESVGVTAVRTACPAVGIPDYTGDITLFRVPGDTSAANMDVTATVTNLRAQCNEQTGDKVYALTTFDIHARRTDTRGARTVSLPWFITVVRGGSAVIAKRVGTVDVTFADGQERASASGQGGAFIDRTEATLPEDIRRKINRKRRAGDEDAAIDPLSEPDVRAAITRATFEVLVGFQLDERQLAYNATR